MQAGKIWGQADFIILRSKPATEVKKPRGDQKWSLLFRRGFKKIDTLAVIEGSFVDEIGREIIIEEKKREHKKENPLKGSHDFIDELKGSWERERERNHFIIYISVCLYKNNAKHRLL